MALIPINKAKTVNNLASVKREDGDVEIKNINTRSFVSSYYFKIGDPKAVTKFIKNVEKLVRTSDEYRRYIAYLSEDMGIINDAITNGIDSDMASLEFHHYPLSLYDIVEIVLNKNIVNNTPITSIKIAYDVLLLHYANKVGLARLTKTNHQLTHAGDIVVPLDSVFGDVNAFMEENLDYIFDDQLDRYNKLINQVEDHFK